MLATIFLSILNAGLVAIPIGGTAGVLAGIDYNRRINGQQPLFSDPGGDGGDGYGGGGAPSGNSSSGSGWDGNKPNATTVVGGTTVSKYCQQYNAVTVNSTGQTYIVNPNQWGYDESEGGSLCLNVTTNNNNTYATNVTAPKWSATWKYPDTNDNPVHAYPNIMIGDDKLPMKLGSLTQMYIDMKWTYSLGKTLVVTSKNKTVSASSAASAAAASSAAASGVAVSSSATAASAAASSAAPVASVASAATVASVAADVSSPSSSAAAAVSSAASAASAASKKRSHAKRFVDNVDFSANVAIDMFFDSSKNVSSQTDKATYEIMVWFAQFGEYTDPIGFSDGVISTLSVEGFSFSLYNGTNSKGQHVLTWIADDTATTFSGNIRPLISALSSLNLQYAPQDTDYMGYFSFGTEAYYANSSSVTFDVQSLSMDLW